MLTSTGITGTLFASGHSKNLAEMFGGKLKVDKPLINVGLLCEGEWEVKGLDYEILKAEAGVSDFGIISQIGLHVITREEIFAALEVLASSEGEAVLQIPEGEEETEVILGYVTGLVVYLEHELEDGKEEEYHLHLRPQKSSWKRAVAVFSLK